MIPQVAQATPLSQGVGNARAASPADTLGAIFAEFSRRRKKEKVAAWMGLQTALAENAGILCPAVVSLKDLIAATANVEDLLKGQSGDAGESPSEYLEKFLSGAAMPSTNKVVTQ